MSEAPRTAGTLQGIAFIALSLMPVLALSGLVPVLPLLFQQFAHEPRHELLVPMIISIPSLCVALFSGIAGAAADRWGRRPLLLAAMLTFTVIGLLPMLFTSLKAIIASRVAVGIAEASVLTVANALLGDYFAEQDRRKWLGYQNMLGSLFGTAIILAGGFLGDWHWRAPFLLYLLGLPVLALAWFSCYEPARAARGGAAGTAEAAFPWRTAGLVCGITLALSLIYYVQALQHGRIFEHLGVQSSGRIGMFIAAASLGTVLGGYLFKRFSGTSMQRWLACSLAAYGVAYLGISLAPGIDLGLPLDAMGQVGGGIMLPTLIAWSLGKYQFEHRGRGMGLWGGAFFLGAFVSPPVLSLLDRFTPGFLASIGVVGVLCLLIAGGLFWRSKSA